MCLVCVAPSLFLASRSEKLWVKEFDEQKRAVLLMITPRFRQREDSAEICFCSFDRGLCTKVTSTIGAETSEFGRLEMTYKAGRTVLFRDGA